LLNTQVKELKGDGKLASVKLDREFNGSNEMNIDGLFIEIGSEPDPLLIKQLSLETDAAGYISVQPNQKTNRDHIWAAGDITTGSNNFRQVITACAEGAIAAEDIFKYIQAHKD